MAGTWRIALCALAMAFVGVPAARAFNETYGLWYAPPLAMSYYYVPSYSYYWVTPYSYYCPPRSAGATVIPLEGPGSGHAQPIPAPPSPNAEPPLKKKTTMPPARTQNNPDNADKRPTIITTRAIGGDHVPGSTPLQKDHCRVGFWNLTGRDVTLTIEGKNWTVRKDRAITLDLERNFAWQVDDGTLQVEHIPEGRSTHEMVLRQ